MVLIFFIFYFSSSINVEPMHAKFNAIIYAFDRSVLSCIDVERLHATFHP